ncbi:MAG: ATP-dependent DNA helicase [Eubacteriaceae bacterium]|jgi:Rad3-related DNA helicase|nr:excision repair protein [Eubacteriaceae bacterium]MDK2961962.1 excision repair protein [Eubacteriaceae bacterium]
MENLPEIKLSVRKFVEFIHRSGDIDAQFIKSKRALEGTRAHQKVQRSYSEADYQAEIALKYQLDYKGFTFLIEGRADGIFINEAIPVIDEIKSTTRPLDELPPQGYPLHWAQAKIYAAMIALQEGTDPIAVQLTYFQLETEAIKTLREVFHLTELKDYFYTLLDHYLSWAKLESDHQTARNQSIKNLSFPYPHYRKGQRQLAIAVYKTITAKEKTFIQAPTGIGKTISTLFPAIKSIAEADTERIFYLTAKTIVRAVAEEALFLMAEKGLLLNSVTLTAKDKICFMETRICDPEHCPYAKGHFDRVNNALYELLTDKKQFSRRVIEDYAQKHQICPFEFSLDLASFCDVIIGDYNYVFDPRVALKYLLVDGKNSIFLIDEAHNLVDRSREMFSAQVSKKMILSLKRDLKDADKRLLSPLKNLNNYMLALKKSCVGNGLSVLVDDPKDLDGHLYHFISIAEEWLNDNQQHPHHADLLSFYFLALTYLKTSEFMDQRYVTYVENTSADTIIKRFCLDPSRLLNEVTSLAQATIFFSATLTPLAYYKELLSGNEKTYHLQFPSPFDAQKRAVLLADAVSTRYSDREETSEQITQFLDVLFGVKTGHYLLFFPSYQYMNKVYELFIQNFPDHNCVKQESEMSEDDRENFLARFKQNPATELIGFCVMGGVFSEGIDLCGDALIGAVIVGVGLPQICGERDLIKDYFNQKNHQGFDYAYVYPGMNKVFQAAGRVIRSDKDKGVIFLIDDRFAQKRYQQLFTEDWYPQLPVRTTDALLQEARSFWEAQEN